MKPSDFPEKNRELQAPKGMDNCDPLPVFCDGKMCVSLWEASWKERLNFLIHGRLWLFVHSGETQPPVGITVGETVFQEQPAP